MILISREFSEISFFGGSANGPSAMLVVSQGLVSCPGERRDVNVLVYDNEMFNYHSQLIIIFSTHHHLG